MGEPQAIQKRFDEPPVRMLGCMVGAEGAMPCPKVSVATGTDDGPQEMYVYAIITDTQALTGTNRI